MAMQDIRAEALALFARYGYEGTSLADIAKAVGIKTPSIYAHFASKDALYLAVLDWVLDEQERLLERSVGVPGTTEEKLKRMYVDFTAGYTSRTESMFYKRAIFFTPHHLLPVVREQVLRVETRAAQAIGVVLEEGCRSGELADIDRDEATASFFCLVDGMFVEHDLYEEELYTRRLEQVWRVFWRGIAAHPKERKGDGEG
ncbi:TetR/AcrR family transcriptional regulator [Paenibacillus chartarius]|uniref:TetR/AcrR family transcriptional regulator n=1 Tax=Paenibacillus chartarius TaxID=747481 RepID=A0ABV6DF79_9BACL